MPCKFPQVRCCHWAGLAVPTFHLQRERSEPKRRPRRVEGMFASLLVKEMRQTLSEGFFGSDTADVYGALFDQYLGQQLAEGEGLGIKQLVLAQAIDP